MADAALSVKNVAKLYRVGAARKQHDSILSAIMSSILQPFHNLRRIRSLANISGSDSINTLWALKDISFDIEEGITVGLIGHNGSGKSTLLKILSRITDPTSGEILVRGKVASLLEVGTGFHPELTGRDNVYLNGAILGMNYQDVKKKFDEIVAFSGVQALIDTPVKHYSSGMKVRLGFAVAAHLEPEILLIDEVLAVGDAEFQKRCMTKMDQVGAEGRTVVFVSHHLPSVARLCKRSILLDHGKIIADGATSDVLKRYSDRFLDVGTSRCWSEEEAPGDKNVRLLSVELLQGGQTSHALVDVRSELEVKIDFRVDCSDAKVTPALHLFDSQSNWVFASIDIDPEWHNKKVSAGRYVARVTIPPNLLAEGMYTIGVSIVSIDPHVDHVFEHECIAFTMFDPIHGDSARGEYTGDFPGSMRPKLIWTNDKVGL